MKKALALILTLCMLLTFVAACNTDTDAGGDAITVDVFWYTYADTFLASVRNAMDPILSGNPNINHTMHD